MYDYIVRRLVFGGLTVLGVSIIVFAVLRDPRLCGAVSVRGGKAAA